MKQNTTYKQTELGLIPDDWEVKKLGEIGNIITGSTPSTTNLEYYKNGTFDFIGPADLNSNKYIDNAEKKVTEKGLNVGRILKQKSVLVTCIGSTIGKIGINKNICITNQQINAIETDKNNSDFIYYSILERKGRLKLIAGEQAVPVLNKTEFSKFKIPLPPLSEQKKIADCLSTWDVAIEKQSALINALTDRKKALMQQLLTGKKRLPGFEGKWKEVKLGSLGKTYNGLTGKTKEDFGEGKPFITYMNIFSNPKINISNFEYVKMGVNENQNKAIYGDIFFTVSSETPNEVGMASVLLDEINDLYLNSFCFGFRLNDFKNLLPEFSSYLFRNDLFRKDVYKLAQGSTRFNLSKLELMKIKIKLPTLSEQTAIAEILATADRELQLQKEKLAQLQTQKKGLMQVLLTGKKRLIN